MKHTALCDKEIKAISLDFQELLCSLLSLLNGRKSISPQNKAFVCLDQCDQYSYQCLLFGCPLARINGSIILYYTKSLVSCRDIDTGLATAERTDHPSQGDGGNYWVISFNIFTSNCTNHCTIIQNLMFKVIKTELTQTGSLRPTAYTLHPTYTRLDKECKQMFDQSCVGCSPAHTASSECHQPTVGNDD